MDATWKHDNNNNNNKKQWKTKIHPKKVIFYLFSLCFFLFFYGLFFLFFDIFLLFFMCFVSFFYCFFMNLLVFIRLVQIKKSNTKREKTWKNIKNVIHDSSESCFLWEIFKFQWLTNNPNCTFMLPKYHAIFQ